MLAGFDWLPLRVIVNRMDTAGPPAPAPWCATLAASRVSTDACRRRLVSPVVLAPPVAPAPPCTAERTEDFLLVGGTCQHVESAHSQCLRPQSVICVPGG